MTSPTGFPRCSPWARAAGVDPGGTAPTTDVFVLVEQPLPWPSDIADDPTVAEIQRLAAGAAGGRRVRLQAVAADAGAALRRVVVFSSDGPPFRGYGRLEAAVPPARLADAVVDLVTRRAPPPADAVTDVLICAHGSRDTCCGSLGTRLWLEQGRTDVSVWRTSHTGGHRFAPTAITFPDGNYWAWLDADVLGGVVRRSLDPSVAATHLRGCAAFSPAAQVADRAVLADRGWSWLDAARFAEQRSARQVELCFETDQGERGGYVVDLEIGDEVPVPDCGTDPRMAKKHQTELRAVAVRASD
jgi:hypothetical protein